MMSQPQTSSSSSPSTTTTSFFDRPWVQTVEMVVRELLILVLASYIVFHSVLRIVSPKALQTIPRVCLIATLVCTTLVVYSLMALLMFIYRRLVESEEEVEDEEGSVCGETGRIALESDSDSEEDYESAEEYRYVDEKKVLGLKIDASEGATKTIAEGLLLSATMLSPISVTSAR